MDTLKGKVHRQEIAYGAFFFLLYMYIYEGGTGRLGNHRGGIRRTTYT